MRLRHRRHRRSTVAVALVGIGFVVSVQPALAQVVPTPPAAPPLPGEVTEAAMPAVPAWDASVGTACNLALTALGLGGLVAGGVPAMLPSTPVVDAGVETRAAIGAVSAAGSACFILPFRTVRTSCAVDAQAEGELSAVGGQAGAPVNPGEFTPHVAGAGVDTAAELENAGAPAGTADALDEELACEQIDLLAQPDFGLPGDLTGGLPVSESSLREAANGQADGLATGLTGDVFAAGDTLGTGDVALGGGAAPAAVMDRPGSAAGAPSLSAIPAAPMSTSRKIIAGVLAGLIALMLVFMTVSHAGEAHRGAPRL